MYALPHIRICTFPQAAFFVRLVHAARCEKPFLPYAPPPPTPPRLRAARARTACPAPPTPQVNSHTFAAIPSGMPHAPAPPPPPPYHTGAGNFTADRTGMALDWVPLRSA